MSKKSKPKSELSDTRLLRLLGTFSETELEALGDFAQSPFFNKRTEVVRLLEHLLPTLKKGRPLPDRVALYQKVFGKNTYDDHRLRMAMSFLHQTACQFLAVTRLTHNRVLVHTELSKALRERQLDERGQAALQAARAEQQASALRNPDFYEAQYHLSLEQYKAEVEARTTANSDLQTLSDHLDDAFLARKLWQACFMHAHSTVHNTHFDYGLLSPTLAYLENNPTRLDTPAIGLYYHCYLALAYPENTAHFQRFRAILDRSHHLFPQSELRDIFVLALNFCSRRYNAGSTVYLQDQLYLYKEGLERGYFLSDGSLSPYTYQNAATMGLIAHELDWVEHIVHTYRDALKPEHREGLYHFNLARLAYRRRRLGEALALLQKAEYKDLLLHLAAKTLQLKVYYELNEHDLLESHLQAFGALLRRKKSMGYHRDNYLHLVNFTQKLLEIGPFDKKERAALREAIAQTPSVAEREWLLERIG